MVTVSRRKLGWLGVSVVLVLAVGLLTAAVFALMALGFRHYTATAYIAIGDGTAGLSHESPAARRELFQLYRATQLEKIASRFILSRALPATGSGQPLIGSARPGSWRSRGLAQWAFHCHPCE